VVQKISWEVCSVLDFPFPETSIGPNQDYGTTQPQFAAGSQTLHTIMSMISLGARFLNVHKLEKGDFQSTIRGLSEHNTVASFIHSIPACHVILAV